MVPLPLSLSSVCQDPSRAGGAALYCDRKVFFTMYAQATGRGGGRGGKRVGRGGSYQFPKQKFSSATTNDPEEGASSGEGRGNLGRPEPKKARWGTVKVQERSIYKEGVAELKAVGVKTEFLYMTSINRSHLESMAEGPLLHNEGRAGNLTGFSMIFLLIFVLVGYDGHNHVHHRADDHKKSVRKICHPGSLS